MSEELPFKNCYKVRRVAEGDSKSCVICFKASATVLITVNSKDFFYVCDSHLADRNFCTPVYQDNEGNLKDPDLAELKAEEAKLLRQLRHLETVRDSKNSQFSKLKGYLSWGGKKEDPETTKEEEGEHNNEKDDEPTSESDLTVEQLNKKIKEFTSGEIAAMKEKLLKFEKQYRMYKLDKVFYKNRLLLDYRRQKRARIQKSLQEGTLFPSLDSLPKLSKPK
ncbi:DEKNAAC100848 [Brettanomyces naardenensis]|uniref:DEKNAAC100848 n=1 Tax=Brettanomyces naardenensis TaxID=13370 RepID=A0A448YGE4_BRENA|nr:DEKNAAC100848 [Brettanomyces naardenensis]